LFLDNWALLFAQKLAIKNKVALHITFCRLKKFLDCSLRHYKHIFKGKTMHIYFVNYVLFILLMYRKHYKSNLLLLLSKDLFNLNLIFEYNHMIPNLYNSYNKINFKFYFLFHYNKYT